MKRRPSILYFPIFTLVNSFSFGNCFARLFIKACFPSLQFLHIPPVFLIIFRQTDCKRFKLILCFECFFFPNKSSYSFLLIFSPRSFVFNPSSILLPPLSVFFLSSYYINLSKISPLLLHV